MVGDFLKIVDKQLKGEEVTADVVKKTAGGSGWIWIIIAIIIVIIIFLVL